MSLGSGFGFPFYSSPGQTRPMRVITSGAPYTLVTGTGTVNAEDCIPAYSGNATQSIGVITTPQGDPNANGIFRSGDIVEVTYTGTVPLMLVPATYTTQDQIVLASGTPGWGMQLGSTHSGDPLMIVGQFADIPAVVASGFPMSVRLTLNPIQRK